MHKNPPLSLHLQLWRCQSLFWGSWTALDPKITATLFTSDKTGKQAKGSSKDGWTPRMWYMYTTEDYSAIKKDGLTPLAETWVDLEMITLSEMKQSQTNTIGCHLHVEPKTRRHRWTSLWNSNRPTDPENKLTVTKGKGRGGINLKDGLT